MSKKKLKKLLIYIPVLIVAAFFFIPLLWMISTSLKGSEEIFISPPRWIPKNIKWKNYKDAFEAIPYVKYILNTVKTTGLAVLGNVISAPMIGYAFGKLKWPGRDKVFLLVIATMMLPTAPPVTARGLNAPLTISTTAVGIFVMLQARRISANST